MNNKTQLFIAIIDNKFTFMYIILKNSFKGENASRSLYFDKYSPIVRRESKNIGVLPSVGESN